MSRWIFILAIILVLPVGVFAEEAEDDFENFEGLTKDEVLISTSGKAEMRVSMDAEREIQKWEFLNDQGQPDDNRMSEMFDYIEEERKTSYYTLVNPFFATGLIEKEKMLTRAPLSEKANGVRIGSDASDADINNVMTESSLEEVETDDGLTWYVKEDGTAYCFENIKINFYFQKLPNTKSVYNRADWDDPDGISELYNKRTISRDNWKITDPIKNPAYSPPGDVAFDAGINDEESEQPMDSLESDAGDVTMETFVELRGKYSVASWDGTTMTTPDVFFFQDDDIVAQSSVYVEDYVPPLPSEIGSLEVEQVGQLLAPKIDSNGNAFIPGMARFYNNDNSGMTHFIEDAINPEESPTPLYYWPNNDPVDRDDDSVNDFTWENIKMKNNNGADLAVNNTFNYEVGMSLYNRVKYKAKAEDYTDEEKAWRYLYYVPYRPTGDKLIGPYAGRVHSADSDKDGFDKYDVDQEGAVEWYAPYYKPIVFAEEITYNGKTYKPLGLINKIYDMEDAGVEVQQKKSTLASTYGFTQIAGISVKWSRECVQGITIGTTADPDLKIPEGTLLLPTGFAAASIHSAGRLGNFDAEYDNREGDDVAKSLIGTTKEGTDARDSFFKINAADCCNNDVVIASGTYGNEDNLKPMPKLVIEAMDSHNAAGDKYFDVATVPNDTTGAGGPIGSYNMDKIYSRVHDASVPLYGSGDQGATDGFRGYGNFSNNAAVWNGCAPSGSLQNPVDREGVPFMATRVGEQQFEEDRRYFITLTGDDNVGPSVELPGHEDYPDGEVFYPIRHLSYSFYYCPGASSKADMPEELSGATFSGNYNSVSAQIASAMEDAGCRKVTTGNIIHIDEFDAPNEEWINPPVGTIEWTFKSPGLWIIRVNCVDRGNNGRIMLVPVEVQDVKMTPRSIDSSTSRID